MKKILCLMLVICALLSCFSMSASADTGIILPDFSQIIRPDLPGSSEEEEGSSDVISDHVNGGTIQLAMGESVDKAASGVDLISTVQSQLGHGNLKCNSTVTISNANVASVQIVDQDLGYVAWRATAVGGGSATLTVSMCIYASNYGLVAQRTWSYTIIVPQERIDVPVTLPQVKLVSNKGQNVTDKTLNVAVDEKATLSVGLSGESFNLEDYYGHDYESTSGSYYVKSVTWTYSNQGTYAKVLKEQNRLSITGIAPGEFPVTAFVTYGYAANINGQMVDAGVNYSVTLKTTVKVGSQLKNPFEGIDPYQVENPFSDIDKSHWAYETVMLMYAAGILDDDACMDGVAPYQPLSTSAATYSLVKLGNTGSNATVQTLNNKTAKFNGSANASRANSVSYLYRDAKAMGFPVVDQQNNPFTDVAGTDRYAKSIFWASANSIVNGYGNGKFGPGDGITREQMCTIMLRMANTLGVTLPETVAAESFKDANQISGYAKAAVIACQKAGIVHGVGDGTFRPKATIDRYSVLTMLENFTKIVTA